MKQAILIAAYKDANQLLDLVNFFDDDFNIYIHLDKKNKFTKQEFESIKSIDKVKLISTKYNVNWASFNHLRAILYLGKEALKNSQNLYFHLISAQDIPIQNINYFKQFLHNNLNHNYIEYEEFPKIGSADNGGLNRLEYFHFNNLIDIKKSSFNYSIAKKIINFQMKLNLKRKLNLPKIYSGSTWWSLNRNAIKHIIDYIKTNKIFLNRFKYTFCPEEYFFQTILLNSPFKASLMNDNLRYIDWKARNGNNPAILDDSDFEILQNSNALFARKIDSQVSKNLVSKIYNEIY